MKKTLAIIVALLMALTLLVSCGDGGGGEGGDDVLKIGMASNANDENMNSQMNAFRQYVDDWNDAGKTPTVEAYITVADASVEKQLADVESLIEIGCAVIYLHSVDLDGMKPAVDACNAAGVLVLEARGMDYAGIDVKYEGANEWMMAEMAFSWYKELMDADPDMVLKMGLLYGLAAQSMQLVRVDYLVELLQKEYGDERVQVAASQPCDWDTQLAMECMENWLQRFGNADMNCIVAAGAMMAMGAAQALVAAGEDMDDWLITTTDATADVLYGINEGICDMTVGIRAEADGFAAAEVCIKMALGQFEGDVFQIGPEICEVIDKNNISEWYKG